jgi:ribosomal protein S18 acetylase RimI-like enzyme
MSLKYTEGVASEQEIYSHLMKCNENFIPHLEKKVNIQEYSRKIFEKAVTFEAWVDGILAGLVAAYFNDLENRFGYVTNVSRMKRYAGLGIASGLMNLCIKYARQRNFKEIRLEVHKDNGAAVSLYRKSGFVDYESKNDSLFMKLELSRP